MKPQNDNDDSLSSQQSPERYSGSSHQHVNRQSPLSPSLSRAASTSSGSDEPPADAVPTLVSSISFRRLWRNADASVALHRRWFRFMGGFIVFALIITVIFWKAGVFAPQSHNSSTGSVVTGTMTITATTITAPSLAATAPAASSGTTTKPGSTYPTPVAATRVPSPTPTINLGLAGYWPFDQGSGATVADASGHGNSGVIQGGVSWAAGHIKGALSFDGSDGEVDINNVIVNVNGDYTVAAWVQLTRTTGDNTIVSQDGNNVSPFFLQYIPSHFLFTVFPTDVADNSQAIRAVATMSPNAGVWYHLVGVHDALNHQIRLYVNGALAATAAVPNFTWTSAGQMFIGRAKFSIPVDFWPGYIDEVRAYNRALSSQEIQALYTSTG